MVKPLLLGIPTVISEAVPVVPYSIVRLLAIDKSLFVAYNHISSTVVVEDKVVCMVVPVAPVADTWIGLPKLEPDKANFDIVPIIKIYNYYFS
jgi:hypothetical protein